MVISHYGVYWIHRKEELPEDGTVCVFHKKKNKSDNIRFGYYAFGYFREKIGDHHQVFEPKFIDYWMPVPVLPGED